VREKEEKKRDKKKTKKKRKKKRKRGKEKGKGKKKKEKREREKKHPPSTDQSHCKTVGSSLAISIEGNRICLVGAPSAWSRSDLNSYL